VVLAQRTAQFGVEGMGGGQPESLRDAHGH
jgi:hypothetical protein